MTDQQQTDQPKTERAIFLQAIDRSPAERGAFLEEVCGEDQQLRENVEALLRAHQQSGDLLDAPDVGSPTLDEPVTEKPGAQIGPYKIREQIGEGGFGVVFVAEQTEPVRRKVALKVIKPGMDTKDVIARFEAERQALALMDHPNVARVLDAGATESGRPYFAMELVQGVPITEFCDEQKLSAEERLRLFFDVCPAVQHAHQKGIIHRDIKPSNVMVTMHDHKPVPKVIDFGVAKAIGSQLTDKTIYTAYGQMVGTPTYMSPEQAQMSGLDVDTRSDVYSLGVLLYELLTGTTPFDKETLHKAGFDELRRIIREDEPPRPSDRISTLRAEQISTISDQRKIDVGSLARSLRGELDWIVMKALEKDRNRRYESASAFAADVERYLADEPVQACPPLMWYRFRKFARRKRGLLTGTAVLSVALLLAIGGTAASIGWALRDREYRSNQLAERVELVLGEVEKNKESQNWIAAREANKRAQSLLSGSGGHEKLRDRVKQHQHELDFVNKLRDVRENRHVLSSADARRQRAERNDFEYAAMFREFGIDVVQLPHEEAADRLQDHNDILPVIATILDDWASSRSNLKKDHKGATALWQLAVAIDSDAWRNKLRQALINRDAETLEKLADSDDVLEQPASTLWLLTTNLLARPDRQIGADLLRRAVVHHPRDFWLNYIAGTQLRGKPRERLAYLHTAHALRPHVYGATHNLAISWGRAGFPDMQIAELQKVLRNKPNFWWPHVGIAEGYQKKQNHELALTHLKRAIDCNPLPDRLPNLHLGVGQRLKRHEQAIALCQEANLGLHAQIGNRLPLGPTREMRSDFVEKTERYFLSLMMIASASKTDMRPFWLNLAKDHPGTAWSYLARALTQEYRVQGGQVKGTAGSLEHLLSSKALCEAACQQNPQHFCLRNALNLVCISLGEPTSVSLWSDAIAANPADVDARLELANAYLEYERWEETIRHLRIVEEQQPGSADLFMLIELLADCQETRLRKPEEALALLQRSEETPNNGLPAIVHFRNGNWEEAAKLMAPHLGSLSHPPNDGGLQAYRYLMAMACWKLGKERDALEWYLSAVLPPRIDSLELRLPQRYHHDASVTIAPTAIIAECTRRLKDNKAASLYLARGEAQARLKKHKAAAADFGKALELVQGGKGWTDPQRVVYQRLSQFPEVVKLMAQQHPDLVLWMEVARCHASFGRWRAAAESYGVAFPKRPLVGLEYAGVLLLSGDHAGYKRVCQQSVQSWKGSESPLQQATVAALVSLGGESGITAEEQIRLAKHAMTSLNSGGGRAATALGMAYLRAGEFEKAVRAFQDAGTRRRGPPLAANAFGMAMAYYSMGNAFESRRWYDYAVMLYNADKPHPPVMSARVLEVDDWIYASVLNQEARGMIEEPAKEKH